MADLLPEKWMRGVAITTTVLAVLTAIASSRSGFCISKAQLLTAQEGSQWAFYQAKSIKQNLLESRKASFEVALAGAAIAEQKALLEKTLQKDVLEIARYDKEKESIKKDAETTGRDNRRINQQATQFSLSVVLLQIAIMLSSVGALLKRKELWLVGLVFGCVGIVYLVNGVFLFF